MKTRILTGALVFLFALGTAGMSFAAKAKCTVESVEGDKVIMTCEGADQMKAGDKVKVNLPKKGAVEGC